MGVIVYLIAFSLLVALFFLGGFFWSVTSGQFDDSHTPAVRMLFDDETNQEKKLTK